MGSTLDSAPRIGPCRGRTHAWLASFFHRFGIWQDRLEVSTRRFPFRDQSFPGRWICHCRRKESGFLSHQEILDVPCRSLCQSCPFRRCLVLDPLAAYQCLLHCHRRIQARQPRGSVQSRRIGSFVGRQLHIAGKGGQGNRRRITRHRGIPTKTHGVPLSGLVLRWAGNPDDGDTASKPLHREFGRMSFHTDRRVPCGLAATPL
jgi:hypothetical protein